MRRYLLIILMYLFSSSLAANPGAEVVVTFSGLQDRGGVLYVTLYKNGDGWLDAEKAYRRIKVTIDAPELSVRFDRLEAGEYGVSAIHDENQNGKMDMRWFPWPRPKEGSGVSNNQVRNGPPRYEDARFTLESGVKRIQVIMRYF